jgi:hypothetical protein
LMALMDAKEYDPRPAQRRKRLIITLILIAIAAGILWFIFRYYPEKRVVDHFFESIEQKNFEMAYAIYNHDPDWKQHPDKYKDYSFSQFKLDWGPSGDYGVINSHEIGCAVEPHKSGFQPASGIIVVVTLNHVEDKPISLWVEKKSKTITLSPIPYACR